MPIDAPLALGPFCIDVMGRLSARLPDRDARFSFVWRNRLMQARLADTVLEMQAVVGRVPSTAALPTARQERMQIFAFLPRLPALLPPEWRAFLAADHRLLMQTSLALATSPVITDLLAAMTMRLISLAPYLDVLEEAGVRPRGAFAAGAGGTIRV
jgi:hypothetical protein